MLPGIRNFASNFPPQQQHIFYHLFSEITLSTAILRNFLESRLFQQGYSHTGDKNGTGLHRWKTASCKFNEKKAGSNVLNDAVYN